jgi:hypothetical protein
VTRQPLAEAGHDRCTTACPYPPALPRNRARWRQRCPAAALHGAGRPPRQAGVTRSRCPELACPPHVHWCVLPSPQRLDGEATRSDTASRRGTAPLAAVPQYRTLEATLREGRFEPELASRFVALHNAGKMAAIALRRMCYTARWDSPTPVAPATVWSPDDFPARTPREMGAGRDDILVRLGNRQSSRVPASEAGGGPCAESETTTGPLSIA